MHKCNGHISIAHESRSHANGKSLPLPLSPDACSPEALFGRIALGHRVRLVHRQRARIGDHHVLGRTIATVGAQRLDLAHHAHAAHHFAEHHVTAVQPAGGLRRDEELRTVRVLARIGHAQPAGTVVAQLEILVLEALAVDGAAAGAVALGEIAALDHKVLDDAMELAALVALAGRLLGQLLEVLRRLRHGAGEHADHDAFGGRAADAHIEEHLQNGAKTQLRK